jgi:hypothetical protein
MMCVVVVDMHRGMEYEMEMNKFRKYGLGNDDIDHTKLLLLSQAFLQHPSDCPVELHHSPPL